MKREIPPRGPAFDGRVMLLDFDVDCGELLPGHRFIAPFEGGPTTHGSRGDWPLPPDATVLTFSLASPDASGFADPAHPAGSLVVDRARGTAVWRPA